MADFQPHVAAPLVLPWSTMVILFVLGGIVTLLMQSLYSKAVWTWNHRPVKHHKKKKKKKAHQSDSDDDDSDSE